LHSPHSGPQSSFAKKSALLRLQANSWRQETPAMGSTRAVESIALYHISHSVVKCALQYKNWERETDGIYIWLYHPCKQYLAFRMASAAGPTPRAGGGYIQLLTEATNWSGCWFKIASQSTCSVLWTIIMMSCARKWDNEIPSLLLPHLVLLRDGCIHRHACCPEQGENGSVTAGCSASGQRHEVVPVVGVVEDDGGYFSVVTWSRGDMWSRIIRRSQHSP
jgi:hypothetical protein